MRKNDFEPALAKSVGDKLIAYNNNPDDPPVLSEEEAAFMVGLSLEELRRYSRAGYGPEHLGEFGKDCDIDKAVYCDLAALGERLYNVRSVSLWRSLLEGGTIPTVHDERGSRCNKSRRC